MPKDMQEAAVKAMNPPAAICRVFHSIFDRKTNITEPGQIDAFVSLHKKLSDICDRSDTSKLPKPIRDLWTASFEHKVLTGPSYEFGCVSDIKKMEAVYRSKTAEQGQVYLDYPLTTTVLSILTSVDSIQKDAKQNLAKIVLGYIAGASLSLSTTKGACEQHTIVEHLQSVVTILIESSVYRTYFATDATDAVKKLDGAFQSFLSASHLMKKAEFIPTAVKNFVAHQRELVSHLFKALLILTEGGNKPKLTFDYAQVAKGFLSEDQKLKIHAHNPFRSILMEVARIYPKFHESYSRELNVLVLPEADEVEAYFRESLQHGHYVGGKRIFRDQDSILYLLERTTENGVACWAKPTDMTTISASSQYVSRLAYWLCFHVCITDFLLNLDFMMSMKGQEWLAQGYESKYIQAFVTQYGSMLDKFKDELKLASNYLNARIQKDTGHEHEILQILGSHVTNTIQLLRTEGVDKLSNIEESFLPLHPSINEIRIKTFFGRGQLLNTQNLGFNLPVIEGPAVEKNTVQAATLATHPILKDMIQHVQLELTNYATKRGFHFNLPYVDRAIRLEPEDPKKYDLKSESYKKPLHRRRIKWMYERFQELYEANSGQIITKLNTAIVSVSDNPDYQSNEADGISALLVKIKSIITEAAIRLAGVTPLAEAQAIEHPNTAAVDGANKNLLTRIVHGLNEFAISQGYTFDFTNEHSDPILPKEHHVIDEIVARWVYECLKISGMTHESKEGVLAILYHKITSFEKKRLFAEVKSKNPDFVRKMTEVKEIAYQRLAELGQLGRLSSGKARALTYGEHHLVESLPESLQSIHKKFLTYNQSDIHQYRFDLSSPYSEADPTASGDLHEVRSAWILECLRILISFKSDQSELDLLCMLRQKIDNLKQSQMYTAFFSSRLGTEMQDCIEGIERIIHQRLDQLQGVGKNAVPDKQSDKGDAESEQQDSGIGQQAENDSKGGKDMPGQEPAAKTEEKAPVDKDGKALGVTVKKADYQWVYVVQEALRSFPELSPTANKYSTKEMTDSVALCSEYKAIDPKNLIDPLHQFIYRWILEPYAKKLTVDKGFWANLNHIGWDDQPLYQLRYYSSGLVKALRTIELAHLSAVNRGAVLEPKMIKLVNICLIARVNKLRKALSWHKHEDKVSKELLNITDGDESIKCEIVLRVKDNDPDTYELVNYSETLAADNAALQAKVESLTKERDEAKAESDQHKAESEQHKAESEQHKAESEQHKAERNQYKLERDEAVVATQAALGLVEEYKKRLESRDHEFVCLSERFLTQMRGSTQTTPVEPPASTAPFVHNYGAINGDTAFLRPENTNPSVSLNH